MPRKPDRGIMPLEQRQKMSQSVRNAMGGKTKSVEEIKAFLRRCSPLDVVIAMQEMQHETSL